MKKEKTLGDLAKEFPDKSYRELEKYRDADRQEEAEQVPLSESQQKQEELEPIEGHEQDNPTLWEIATTHKVSYADAIPIQENMRLQRDALKEACTLAEMRKDRTPLSNMKQRAQEAEGELSIMKQLETNRVKEAQDALANALEVNESHQKMNGKLQERLTELEEENKKMHDALNNKLNDARKAGL